MLAKILLCGLCLYLAYGVLLFLVQRQILFPRFAISLPAAPPAEPGVEKIWLDTASGRTEAWLLPAVGAPARAPFPALIFAHGNGEVIDFWPPVLQGFTSFGLHVMLVEYPGYGRSEGRPSEESIAAVFVAAYDRLAARRDVDPARIVLMGRSLGGGRYARWRPGGRPRR